MENGRLAIMAPAALAPPHHPSAPQAYHNALRFLPNSGHVCVRREHNICSFVLRKCPFYFFLLFRSSWAFFYVTVKGAELEVRRDVGNRQMDFFFIFSRSLLSHFGVCSALNDLNNINANTCTDH